MYISEILFIVCQDYRTAWVFFYNNCYAERHFVIKTFYDVFSFFLGRFLTSPLACFEHVEENYITTFTSLIRGKPFSNNMDDSDHVSFLSDSINSLSHSLPFIQQLRNYRKGHGCCAVGEVRSPISVPHLAGLLLHLLFFSSSALLRSPINLPS